MPPARACDATDQHLAGPQSVTEFAVSWRAHHPGAVDGADQIADRGHDARVGAAVGRAPYLSSLKGWGSVNPLSTSGFAGFRPPCGQRRVRTGVKTERPQRSEDERS